MTNILCGDNREILRTLPNQSIQCCVTSPPYFGLRDYGMDDQMGLEATPEAFVKELVDLFREVRRVLKDDGTLWLNLGDSYAGAGYSNHKSTGGAQREDGGKQRHLSCTGYKNKDLIGIPWRVAFALQADGWYLRQDIIWHKPNPMPESVRDRCTKAHEYLFLLSKSQKYFFDSEAMKEPATSTPMKPRNKASEGWHDGCGNGNCQDGERVWGADGMRNRRSVWTVNTKPYKGAHFATFPPDLIRPCILAGAPAGGMVLDPFAGSGTTGLVCKQEGRAFTGIELNPEYVKLAQERIATGK